MFDPPWSAGVSLVCDVLEDVVGALGLPPAVFIGNSVGGAASLRLAARMPERVRALVLVDSGGLVAPSPLVRAYCWVQGRELVRRWTGLPSARAYLRSRCPGVEARLARMAPAHKDPAFVAMTAAMWRSFGTPENDLSRLAPDVRCPALIVWGRHDPVLRARVEAKRVRQAVPHAAYVELDTGHVPFLEDPPAFLAAVAPFLNALPAGAPSELARAAARAPT
jgi:pimeloyl-ACP methyl ester carboxylesterase